MHNELRARICSGNKNQVEMLRALQLVETGSSSLLLVFLLMYKQCSAVLL